MGKRRTHVMNYKCCENCINKPESLYKKCKYAWNVFGGSTEQTMCIFKRVKVEKPEEYSVSQESLEEYQWYITRNRFFYRKALDYFDSNIRKGNEDIVFDSVEFKTDKVIISYSNVETEKNG